MKRLASVLVIVALASTAVFTGVGCSSSSSTKEGAATGGTGGSDSGLKPRDAGIHDSGLDVARRHDAGSDGVAPTDDCPGLSNKDCTAELHDCMGACAINCTYDSTYNHGWVRSEMNCTHLGQCVPGQAGAYSSCTGHGWAEFCDRSFTAQCVENVAIGCDRGSVRLLECGLGECWADGALAGCRSPSDPQCNGSVYNACPCCNGLVCDYKSRKCRAGQGSPCATSPLACARGLRCSDDGTGVLRCLKPSCLASGTLDPRDGMLCGSDVASVPCCNPLMHCSTLGSGHDPQPDPSQYCCVPSGTTPVVKGVMVPSMCCSGGVDQNDKCF